MKPYIASLINVVFLIGFGLWGYLGSENPSPTALIPVVFGGLILAMNPGIRKENKIIAHIAVLLTLLIFLGLIMPLRGAIVRGDTLAILRVATMTLTTLFALVIFVKSFIDVRKNKQ